MEKMGMIAEAILASMGIRTGTGGQLKGDLIGAKGKLTRRLEAAKVGTESHDNLATALGFVDAELAAGGGLSPEDCFFPRGTLSRRAAYGTAGGMTFEEEDAFIAGVEPTTEGWTGEDLWRGEAIKAFWERAVLRAESPWDREEARWKAKAAGWWIEKAKELDAHLSKEK